MEAEPDIDRAKVAAMTDEDVARSVAKEGYDLNSERSERNWSVPTAAELRQRVGMTQNDFARLLRIPVATLRNWEQGRSVPDPAARTLLALVAGNPKNAFEVLGWVEQPPALRQTSRNLDDVAVEFALMRIEVRLDPDHAANANIGPRPSVSICA